MGMACITVPLENKLKEKMDAYAWVNWSEVGRLEVLKKDILDRYVKTGKLSDKDWEFCRKIDWHPVDELPVKDAHVKRLKAARKEKSIKLKSAAELFR